MGLKFRRGTTAQQSGSLAFGEPYVNTTLGTLVIGGATGDIILSTTGTGSTGTFGAISGSGLDITGNAKVGGNLTIGGAITIGDNTSDVVNVVASLSSSLIPSNDNVFNIGSTSYRYANVYATTVSASAYTGLGNLTTYSTSVDSRLVAAESFSSSLDSTFATDASVTIVSASAFGAFTSASSYSASAATDLSASNAARVALSASVAASGFAVSSSVASATAASITALSSSVAASGFAVSSSVASATAASITALSSSVAAEQYAKLNASNVFTGTQTITGSLFVSANLVIQGSSSLQNITASAISIGTNQIILNTNTPAVRYAGISVFDSGSTNVTSSLFYDGLTNNWKFGHNDTGTTDASILLFGPLGSDLNSAPTLTGNFLTKVENNLHGHHLTTSSIEDNGTKVTINNPLDVTGNVSASTISGIGNVTAYSTSVASRVNTLETAGYAVSSSVASATAASITALSSSVKAVTDTFATSASVASATATSISTLSGSVKTVTDAISTRVTTLEGKDISVTLTGDVTGTGTITDLGNVSFATTIAANSVALGTDTTGDYVASMTAGTGITVGTATGEGSTPVITNTGVTSAVAGTGVTVSAGTGAVTFSIGQAVATNSAVSFASVAATGDIVAFSSSDRRFKNNIVNISDALNKVKQLNGVTWEWNDDVNDVTKSSPKTGLIAQEVQEVLPEVVSEREDGYLGLDYSKMVGLLVEAIKEQQTQIAELKAEVEALKK
jgi:hypothetical protein